MLGRQSADPLPGWHVRIDGEPVYITDGRYLYEIIDRGPDRQGRDHVLLSNVATGYQRSTLVSEIIRDQHTNGLVQWRVVIPAPNPAVVEPSQPDTPVAEPPVTA